MRNHDNRKEQRFEMVLPVTYGWVEGGVTKRESGQTRNVSSRGMFINSHVIPKLGTSVELDLSLDGFAPRKHGTMLHGKAVVVRNEFEGFATSGKVKMASFDTLQDFGGAPKGSKHN